MEAIYPVSIDTCGYEPVYDVCGTSGTATLTVTPTLGSMGNCGFLATLTVSPGAGWSVTDYSYTDCSISSVPIPSSSTTFSHPFSLTSGHSCVIFMTVDLVDAYGDVCTITKEENVSCTGGVGTVTTAGCGTLSLVPLGVSYLNGNCGYGFNAYVSPIAGWTILKYVWNVGLYGATHTTSSTSDSYPSITLSPGTSKTATVTVTLTDGLGDTCTLTQTETVSCPGCGPVVINPIGNITATSCTFACEAVVTPDPGWNVIDYMWDGPSGQIVDQASQQQPDMDIYQSFTMQPGTSAAVWLTVHLNDGNGDDCYEHEAASVGCPSECGTLLLTPDVQSNANYGCIVSTSAVVMPDNAWVVLDYNWAGPAGQYTDITSNTQDVYQGFSLQSNSSAQVSVSVDLTDIWGYGDICTITQTTQATCPANRQSNAGLSNVKLPKSGIIVYPNPTVDGNIYISSSASDITHVEVFDVTGKKLNDYNFSNLNQAQISIGAYAAGSYLIKVNSTVQQIVSKIN